ncbi:MAG: hypothetical protein AAFR38_05855 [Planctomycetota bacterium]
MNRSGFILPLVTVLTVVIGLVTAAMLQRHTAQLKTVQRQLVAYQANHGSRGLQEVVERFLADTRPAEDFRDVFDPDGLGFTLRPGDGTAVRVYFYPAQGTLRLDAVGLPPDQIQTLEDALFQLRQTVPPTRFAELTRAHGPERVGWVDAPLEVKQALSRAIFREGNPTRFVRELDDRLEVEGNVLGRQVIQNAALDADATAYEANLANELIAAEPILWDVRIRVTDRTGRLVGNFKAFLLRTSENGRQNQPFLSWEDLGVGP